MLFTTTMLVAAALALAAPMAARGQAVSTTVKTCGCFESVVGMPAGKRFCGDNCGLTAAGKCESRERTCPGANFGTRVDSQVRWGQSVTFGMPYAQSGMGFTGEKGKQVSFGREFYVGRLTHFNHPIVGPARAVHLRIQLEFPDFPTPIKNDFRFRLDIDETTNMASAHPMGRCPYPSTVDCSDKITFDLNGFDKESTFRVGAIDYTMALTGFKETRQSTSLPAEFFISNEQRENNAFLFAKIVAACPADCEGGGMPEFVLGPDGTYTCKCLCPETPCTTPGYARDERCKCTCDKLACNGYKGDENNNCKCICPTSPMEGCPPPRTHWDAERCECTCPPMLCPPGTAIGNEAKCECLCGAKQCPPGQSISATCECECPPGITCPEGQSVDPSNCGCKCNDATNMCPPGFDWVPCPGDATKCCCECKNKCGSGCNVDGVKPECVEGSGGQCCKNCKWSRGSCDDNDKCTTGDACSGSGEVCKGKSICPEPRDSCEKYVCNPAEGVCRKEVEADGARCGPADVDPENYNLCERWCQGGRCVEKPPPPCANDPSATDPFVCEGLFCNPKTGMCENGIQTGKRCNDKNPCTTDDKCGPDAVCNGKPLECTEVKACHRFVCNPLAGGVCEATPVAFGSECSAAPGDKCATAGTCAGGVCLTGKRCPPLNRTENWCNTNECVSLTGQCIKKPRPVGSRCIEPSGFAREDGICGGNFTCVAPGVCDGERNPMTVNHSLCTGLLQTENGGDAETVGLIVGLTALGAVICAIVLAAILFMYVSKNALTDPSTWNLGNQVGLENNPMYEANDGQGYNPMYRG